MGYLVFKRPYSWTEQSFPKITTHYTVYPREKDSRWEGNFSIEQIGANEVHVLD